MSFSTYSDLQTSITNYMARDDLASVIPDFIQLTEAVGNRRLRTRQQELTASLTPVNAVATIPADYLVWRRVTWAGSFNKELEYVHPSYLQGLFPTMPSGNPTYFTIEGSNLRLAPTDNSPLTFDYFQAIPALATNSTNWLLTAYPDFYLCGALTEAHAFVKDPESTSFWGARRDAVIDEIVKADQKTRGGGAIRTFGPTP